MKKIKKPLYLIVRKVARKLELKFFPYTYSSAKLEFREPLRSRSSASSNMFIVPKSRNIRRDKATGLWQGYMPRLDKKNGQLVEDVDGLGSTRRVRYEWTVLPEAFQNAFNKTGFDAKSN
jgi:hypothetical protein